MPTWLRRAQCSQDEVIFVTRDDHQLPLSEGSRWMTDLQKFKPPDGPRFPDGSINWQCPCMAGGSMVAHRCGHFFRKFYICVSANNYEDATVNCPNEFVDWSACMQNLSAERREQMRRAMTDGSHKKQKDQVLFVDKQFHEQKADESLLKLLEPVESEPVSMLPDGRINIQCHCLQSSLAHQCGHLIRQAISCFNASTRSPRGADCEEEFTRHAMCVNQSER